MPQLTGPRPASIESATAPTYRFTPTLVLENTVLRLRRFTRKIDWLTRPFEAVLVQHRAVSNWALLDCFLENRQETPGSRAPFLTSAKFAVASSKRGGSETQNLYCQRRVLVISSFLKIWKL